MPTYTDAYTVGDVVRLSFSVLSTGSTYVNTAVTFIVNPPADSTATSWTRSAGPTTAGTTAIAHDATGRWHADYFVAVPGRHTFAMRSTGTVRSSTGGAFAARALGASS